MNVLFIASYPPFPLVTGGRIRMFHLLRHYAAKHEVTVVCLCRTSEDLLHAEKLADWCRQVLPVPVCDHAPARSRQPFPMRWAKKALSPIPHFIRSARSAELAQRLATLSLQGFDIVHIERTDCALTFLPFLQQIRGITVLDLHDIDAVVLRRRIPYIRNRKRRALVWLDLVKLLWFDPWLLKQYDLCLVCSETDRVQLEGRARGSRILVVPNGVDTDRFRPRPEQERPLTVLYLGYMGYWPNEDAVLYFARTIWPRIRQSLKNASFLIAGGEPSGRVVELRGRDGIEVLGEVPDQAEAFAQCSIVVAPLRVGSGTRVKLLEAMAMGKAIVSTSVGCEGIDIVPGRHLLVADTPEVFSRECVRLLSNPHLRTYLGQNGRALVEERYRWEEAVMPLKRALESGRPEDSNG